MTTSPFLLQNDACPVRLYFFIFFYILSILQYPGNKFDRLATYTIWLSKARHTGVDAMLSACLHCITIELFIYELGLQHRVQITTTLIGCRLRKLRKIGFDSIATERRLRRNGRRQRRYGIFHVANVISLRKLRWLRNSLRKIRETDYGTDGTDVTWGWKPGISRSESEYCDCFFDCVRLLGIGGP